MEGLPLEPDQVIWLRDECRSHRKLCEDIDDACDPEYIKDIANDLCARFNLDYCNDTKQFVELQEFIKNMLRSLG